MAFDDDEKSAEQNRPIDLYTLTLPTATYRLTSAWRDVAFGSETYTAMPVSRGPQDVPAGTEPRELIVYLPQSHAIVQRYAASGIPPGAVLVKVERLQQVSGVAQQIFDGYATSLAYEAGVATLRCPSVVDDPLRVRLPVVAVQRSCNHILYDAQCQVARASFLVATTANFVDGVDVTITAIGGNPDQWARYGELVHVATGERRTILSQIGTTLVIDVPIVEMVATDAVEIYAGCDHTVETCRDTFANVANFGGHPQMSTGRNLWSLSSSGML